MTELLGKFLQYGVTSTLAAKAVANGLSVSKVRTLSLSDLESRFGMSRDEGRFLKKAVVRQPIEDGLVHTLLERNNNTCCICKGVKSPTYVIHHITPYEESQDNSYGNLAVLCPNDHDLAHQGGLSLRIAPDQIQKSKYAWEKQCELANAQKAARMIDIYETSVHYVNIKRIEELCFNLFGSIPATDQTASLMRACILNRNGNFDQKYVQTHLSGGRYLFDYMNAGETRHYSELLRQISGAVEFLDLSDAADHGWKKTKALEGKYAFFIGGVTGQSPAMPITDSTPPVLLYYNRKKIRIEWLIDPMFLMSNTSIGTISGRNHFIVYCLVRSVGKDAATKQMLVKAQPLLIAQPKVSVDKTPAIAYRRRYEEELAADEEEDDFMDDLDS
jgi:5-methylcytosine-specific restriction endonuclease McrA